MDAGSSNAGQAVADEPVAGPSDPLAAYTATITQIITDILPSHARELVEKHHAEHEDRVVEILVNNLFENPNSYPKTDKKGKRKRKRDDEEEEQQKEKEVKVKVDYASADRPFKGGEHYIALALATLLTDFPYIPTPYIRKTFYNHNALYAPTHIALTEASSMNPPPYKVKQSKNRPAIVIGFNDLEFDAELGWLLARNAPIVVHDEGEGDELECGCCFTGASLSSLIQCPDGHLFCSSCVEAYSESKLSSHDAKLVCMDTTSDCKLIFPESELARALSSKLLKLYHRVRQKREIEEAGLSGWEECPFCDYGAVIENEEEKLFTCANCEAVSCRKCKRLDHLPKSCKEMEEDTKLDARHAVEEAMTKALMRNCPKCQRPFIKEFGCNKMMCTHCNTLSCYMCRSVITGYDHFNEQPGQRAAPPGRNTGKCKLWDDQVGLERMHAEEVRQAAERAQQEQRADNPDLDGEDVHVDLPAAPAAPPPGGVPAPGRAAIVQHHHHPHVHGAIPVVFGAPNPMPVGFHPHLPAQAGQLDAHYLNAVRQLRAQREAHQQAVLAQLAQQQQAAQIQAQAAYQARLAEERQRAAQREQHRLEAQRAREALRQERAERDRQAAFEREQRQYEQVRELRNHQVRAAARVRAQRDGLAAGLAQFDRRRRNID